MSLEPFWAICFHTNSRSPRARKWYRVSRLVRADGGIYELYWHPDASKRGDNLARLRASAGVKLESGVYAQRQGGTANEMERVR